MINFALKKKASDVHIEPTYGKVRLRYRIDGILRDIAIIPKSLHPAIISRVKISAPMRIDEQRIPQDGRFDVVFKDKIVVGVTGGIGSGKTLVCRMLSEKGFKVFYVGFSVNP